MHKTDSHKKNYFIPNVITAKTEKPGSRSPLAWSVNTGNFGVFSPRRPIKEYKFLKLTSKNPVIIIQLNETKT